MSKEDLDFWMDDDSNSNNNEISDEDDDSSQIEAVISPNSKSAKKQKSKNTKFKKKKRSAIENLNNDDDDDDDDAVVITGMPDRGPIPREFTEELTPFENQYVPPISKSRESQALEYAVESLKNDINKMLHDDDDDDFIPAAPVAAPILKKEGDLTIIFVYPPEDFQEERILRAGQSFMTVFQTLPERFEDYSVQIDGVTYDPKEVLNELLVDYTKVVLTEPDQSGSLKGLKKLSFVLPSGDKKKLALDPNTTFKEVLIKLGIPNGKLMFDGEELLLNQKISENDDLEDGDQIDVC